MQPLTLQKVTVARKPASEVTKATDWRRAKEVHSTRNVTSGGDVEHQMVTEMKLVSQERLKEMLQSLKLDLVRIPDGHLLSAKTDLNMSWNQTRELKRWLNQYGITCESQKKSRSIAGALLANQEVKCELLPFTVRDDDGCRTVQLRPAASVKSLTASVLDNLQRKAEAGNLTWHGGMVPEDEIWVKILGDYGGDTYKTAFQVLNCKNPNSGDNTVVFSLFKAKESSENITTGTSQFVAEIEELKAKVWRLPDGRDIHFRIFAATDYALLSKWYGISGACGVRPCVYCEVKKESMHMPKKDREIVIHMRSLERMDEQHKDFLEHPEVDQAQVLHHHALHGMLPYVVAVEEARQVDDQIAVIQADMDERENNLTWSLLYGDSDAEDLLKVQDEVTALMEKKRKLEQKWRQIKEKAKVTTTNGPLAQHLDKVLQRRHVRRQAYHGKAFVGNHIHIMLKEEAIEDLTGVAKHAAEVIVTEVEGFPLSIVTKAQQVHLNYKKIMILFAECYRGYSHARPMSAEDISALDRNITAFMTTFRELFPTSTFPIKLHLLEDHIVEWVSR
ncbi:Hypp9715 [Branchiostoma lanceolatum]|uniref:Hypp9715 protein n=1 Tax=Branchiostoma lanceolatum TaxID=7740 RepID=A0A8S4MQ92_BRALA|nr:Hypp9715 [Branchiostoma lanceolatum]